MSKTWYPKIDEKLCIKCGACIANCKKGVYDKTKAPVPVVINPTLCSGHCHGCGAICPVGAITYVGEDTEWTPPHKQES